MMEIRREAEKDFSDVFQVVSAAFGNESEAKLIERLRNAEPFISLVAAREGEIVGHIGFSALTLDDEPTDFLGLAPMAVAPEFQNQGIGSNLVREGLKLCADAGFTAVFVLGHPEYYPRFGFKTAKLSGFSCEYPAPDEAFMVLELEKGALAGRKGLIKYRPEFAEL